MASVRLPGMTSWGNSCSSLLGALGPSLFHGGGLGALFFGNPFIRRNSSITNFEVAAEHLAGGLQSKLCPLHLL